MMVRGLDGFNWNVIHGTDNTEDLPKKSGNYLVSTIHGADGNMSADVYVCSYDFNSNTWEAIDYDIVVAWAVLPRPCNDNVDIAKYLC